ncbi:hypothetical protein MP638_003017 [Amoeboaphelidium occidentale]|nr:hypothetical protein MP638_003017 [Amoeboaphelidium occidentale]
MKLLIVLQLFLLGINSLVFYNVPDASHLESSYNDAVSYVPAEFLDVGKNGTNSLNVSSWTTSSSLYSVMFNNNETLLFQIISRVFGIMDGNKDSELNRTEVVLFLSRSIGVGDSVAVITSTTESLFRFYDADKNDILSLDEVQQLSTTESLFRFYDADKNDILSLDEVQQLSLQHLESQSVDLPAQMSRVCDYVGHKIMECLDNMSEQRKPYLDGILKRQMQLCRSGFSLVSEGFKVEKCIMKNVDSSARRCGSALVNCLHKSKALEKRAIMPSIPTAASASFQKLFLGLRAMVPVLIILYIALFVGLIAFAFSSAYDRRLNEFWLQQIKFERYELGTPLPPANTPFIYWSPDCFPVYSKESRKCPTGQLYALNACVGFSAYGRKCGFLGCQPLCADISRRDGFDETLSLGYNSMGVTVAVPRNNNNT